MKNLTSNPSLLRCTFYNPYTARLSQSDEHLHYSTKNDISSAITIVIANVYAITNDIAYAYAYAYVIGSARKLEKLEIFNNVNFNVLIDQLEGLKAEVPKGSLIEHSPPFGRS